MTGDAPWVLQEALYQTLSADSALTTLLGGFRIYDHVPQGSQYPYVTIGENIARDWSTASSSGAEHQLTLHIWSKAAGRKQAHEIMTVLSNLLHDENLMLNAHVLVNLRLLFSEVRRDPDGKIFHGIMRFRAVTEPAV